MSIRELEEKLFDEWQEKEKLEYNKNMIVKIFILYYSRFDNIK